MITRPWGNKTPAELVDSWTWLGKEARIIALFNPIISSAQVASVSGGIPSVAENMLADLARLANEGSDPIKIVINSPGGSTQAGFTILQFMEHLKACGIEIWTINMSNAMSMAGIILAMGTPGRRYSLNHTTTHVHEVQIAGLSGRGSDIDKVKEHIDHQRSVIEKLLAENTKIPEYSLTLSYKDDLELLEAHRKRLSEPKFRQKLVKDFSEGERLLTVDNAKEAGMIDGILMPGSDILSEIFLIPAREKENQS